MLRLTFILTLSFHLLLPLDLLLDRGAVGGPEGSVASHSRVPNRVPHRVPQPARAVQGDDDSHELGANVGPGET